MASLILAGFLVWFVLNIRSLNVFLDAYRGRNRERDNVEQLRRKVTELELQAQALERGTFEKEKSIREQFQMVRPGEKLIRLVEDEKETSATAAKRLRQRR